MRLRRLASALQGFSLVEVLCAVLIVAVALVGLTEGISTALRSNKDSELQTTAVLFAAGLIETARAEGGLVNGTSEGACGPGLTQYEWKQSITSADIDGLHEVTIAVHHSTSGKTICELKTLLFEAPYDYASTSKTKQQPRSNSTNRRTRS